MASIPIPPGFDRARWQTAADWLAVGVAVFVPWSTSLTEIFVVLWLVAFLPTLFLPAPDLADVRRAFKSAAGYLPVLLCVLAAAGMLWAVDVSWAERLGGFEKFPRLVIIPLLLAHFQRSQRGVWVLYGFFAATFLLLIASWGLAELPGLSWRGARGQIGVPVNDYFRQDSCFLVCTFVLLGLAVAEARAKRWGRVLMLVAAAAFFLADIFLVVTSRTALIVAPVLLLALGWREFRWKGVLGAVLLGVIVGGAVWLSSPYLRDRLATSVREWQAYRASDAPNSTGLRAEFLRKSLAFVEAAPLIGHGTGSIPHEFRQAATGEGASAAAPANPHNQIFAIAIQLGLVGAAVLVAMWIAHIMLFTGGGFAALAGFTVVAENFLSSLFNSHLFDTGEGWLYIFGIGVAGGLVLRARAAPPRPA
jgi:hypothetical protein